MECDGLPSLLQEKRRTSKNVIRANNARTINYSNVIGTNNYYRVSLRY